MSVAILPVKNRAVAFVDNAVPLSLTIGLSVSGGAVNRVTVNRKAGYQVLHSLGNAIYYAGFVERACVVDIQGVLYGQCPTESNPNPLIPAGSILRMLGSCRIYVGGFHGKCVEVVESYIGGPVSSFGLRLVGVYG